MSPHRDEGRPFEGTAWYYTRFRPLYPDTLEKILREKFALDSTGRLLDLGCGPGTVAIRLARFFEHVVAMDPEPDMLAQGQVEAARTGVSNIEWVRGIAEELTPALGQFRLVTIGNAFHRMDQARVLDAVYPRVCSGGGIAIIAFGAPIPAPPPTRWRLAINDVIRRYVGNRELPGDSGDPPVEERFEAYVSRSRFTDMESYEESVDVTWTIESMLGNLYSSSFCSRKLLGDRIEAFERDIRAAILAIEPSGELRDEPPQFFLVTAHKR
jgi:ubiquinone/menaquinone biosynthesis C-methylase UbiE